MRRSLAALAPLLVLFVVLTAVHPDRLEPLRHPCHTHAGSCHGDEEDYIQFARNIEHGFYARDESNNEIEHLWFGPGLPLLLSPFTAIGLDESELRYANALLLFGAVLLFYALLRLYARRTAALAGAYALGLYWPFWTVLSHVASEPLALLLVVAAMYGLARHLRDGRRRWLALAAVALGWLALTRVIFGWVLAGVLVAGAVWWLVARRRGGGRVAAPRALVLATLGALLVCVPWLAYTYSRSDRVFYWGNSGGLQLYWMAPVQPGTLGDWHSVSETLEYPPLARHRPLFGRIEALAPLERDKERQRVAWRAIRERPRRYLANVVSNVGRLLFSVPYSFTPQKSSFLFYAVPNAFLIVGVVLSAVVLALRRRFVAPEIPAFALVGAVAFTASALVAGYPRMLFPVIPIALAIVFYTVTRHVRLAQPES